MEQWCSVIHSRFQGKGWLNYDLILQRRSLNKATIEHKLHMYKVVALLVNLRNSDCKVTLRCIHSSTLRCLSFHPHVLIHQISTKTNIPTCCTHHQNLDQLGALTNSTESAELTVLGWGPRGSACQIGWELLALFSSNLCDPFSIYA